MNLFCKYVIFYDICKINQFLLFVMKKKYFFKKLLFVVSLLLIFIDCNTAQDNGFDTKKLDSYIVENVKKWEIPGLSIAIVQKDKVIFSKGYGIREYGKKDKVDGNTLFAVASNTKTFTAAALSILVAQGRIKWDDKVIDYIPYFQLYDDYVTNNMTIADLLSHRSGLKTFAGDLLWYGTKYSREDIIKRAKYLEPSYAFRTTFGYSNIMFLVAGQIIESVTDTTWEDYIKNKFLVPLEMNSTYTTIRDFKTTDNRAMPHHVVLGEKPVVMQYLSWDNIAPAGSLISSVNDMSQWIRMMLADGKYKTQNILDAEQIWQLFAPQTIIDIDSWMPKYWKTRHFNAYCLGWETLDYHGVKVMEHGGGADGMISKMFLVPEEDFGVMILTNSINYLPTALAYYILDMYFNKIDTDWSSFYFNFYKRSQEEEKVMQTEAENSRDKTTKPTLDLKNYCGTYKSDMYGEITLEMIKDNLQLNFLPSNIFTGELTHWQNDTFKIVLKNVVNLPSGKVNFILNETNTVTEMKIDIPNPDFDFTEIKLFKIK